jgi:hypothetical protein
MGSPMIPDLTQPTTYNVDTYTVDTSIVQNLYWKNGDSIMGDIYRRVLDVGEAQVRQALIDMGWTPPPQ